MCEKPACFAVRPARETDYPLLFDLIQNMALYEKRPQDVTGDPDELCYWLFDREIARAFIAECDGQPCGYAIYYPVFSSFACKGTVHLEDIFLQSHCRGAGLGTRFLGALARYALEDGYEGMEWSCLDWNESSLAVYLHLGAHEETGRRYFAFDKEQLEKLSKGQ